MVDECHLLWGDACGYVWGPRGERVTLPITNVKARQTYYGALNLLTGQTTLWEAETGNMEYTVGFLTYLRQVYQGRRMLICWDRASSHQGALVQAYLAHVNGLASREADRAIQLELFAPRDPTQNPIEDVWLRGKRAVRQHWATLQSFADVKAVFRRTITHQPFISEKLNWYGREVLIAERRSLGFQWE
jgi:transposase